MNNFCPEQKIILALDGLDIDQSIKLLQKCREIQWVKVGLELFSREGPNVIQVLKKMNKKIFLDLKFHDIPNTMQAACYQVSQLGVDIISLHACSGLKALISSKQSSIKGSLDAKVKPPLIVGITVLTSFSFNEFQRDLNRKSSIEDNVTHFAKISYDAGLDGCVCSPWEAMKLRKIYKKDFQLITPGIRIGNMNKDDQNRVMTPRDALVNGSSKLVIGRSITKANDPCIAFADICRSISDIND